MHNWLLVCFLALSFPVLGQDDRWKPIPIENAYQIDSSLKKVVDALEGKIFTISKFCLDDTCKEWHRDDIDSSYCFFTGWRGTQQGEDVFISSSLKDVHYLNDPIYDEIQLSFWSCAPLIGVQRLKNDEHSIYIIQHISNSGRYTMEMTLLDNGGFVISGPALYIDKKIQRTEYRIANPTKEAAEAISKQLR